LRSDSGVMFAQEFPDLEERLPPTRPVSEA